MKFKQLKLYSAFGAALFGSVAICQQLNAQTSLIPTFLQGKNTFIDDNFEVFDSTGWFLVKENVNLSPINFWDNYKSHFDLRGDDDYLLVRTTNDDYPFIEESKKMLHQRYNQTYKGFKVEHAEVILHSKNDRVEIVNGKFVANLNLSTVPALDEATALNAALGHYSDRNYEYTWLDSTYEATCKEEKGDPNANTFPKGELIIARNDNTETYTPSDYVLAWKFDIDVLDASVGGFTVYVDANTGDFLKERSHLRHGDAMLKYGYNNGNAAYIDTRWRGGVYQHYVLRSDDQTLKPKIWTKKDPTGNGQRPFGGYNCTGGALCIYNSFNQSDTWGSDKAEETTGHWLMTGAWNFFDTKHNRRGWDGSGLETKLVVGVDDDNAWYNHR